MFGDVLLFENRQNSCLGIYVFMNIDIQNMFWSVFGSPGWALGGPWGPLGLGPPWALGTPGPWGPLGLGDPWALGTLGLGDPRPWGPLGLGYPGPWGPWALGTLGPLGPYMMTGLGVQFVQNKKRESAINILFQRILFRTPPGHP